MSAPPLPDIFGNYVLGDFVEVVSPDTISWLPQTAGWLWLGIIISLLLLRYGWQRTRHWYRNRYRREATVQLQLLGRSSQSNTFLVDLNRLLKLTALAAYSRPRVARLSGQAWSDFLNGDCAEAPFTKEQQQLLAVGAYTLTPLTDSAREQLLRACHAWIKMHRGQYRV